MNDYWSNCRQYVTVLYVVARLTAAAAASLEAHMAHSTDG
jgi:hypothetical protein